MSDNFRKYSFVYDSLNQEKDYEKECDYLISLLDKYQFIGNKLYDFGCGTGKHALKIARKGYDVFGIDLSEEMVNIAQQEIKNQNFESSTPPFFQVGDVRRFRGEELRPAIYSLFHVASYQTSNQDLTDYFDSAAANLNQGGLFVFDYWYRPAVEFLRPQLRVKKVQFENYVITRISEPSKDNNANTMIEFTIFIENLDSGKIEKINETHLMKSIDKEDIINLVNDNFEILDTFEWLKDTPPTKETWNAVTILRKK